jgi:chromosomal replication initiation ATPase DnaA
VTGAQLVLDFALEPRFGREDFLAAPSNEAALAVIETWPRWPDRVQLLVGPEGAGKSHLGAIWANQAGARSIAATALDRVDMPGLVDRGAVLVEDGDRIDWAGEAALFHLANLVRESGAFLLLTARRRPDHWGLRTADLLSRLRSAPAAEIGQPDDALVRAVLVKLVADRQIAVEADVVDYVARRIERSPAAARAVVAALDRESLVLGRRVTKAIAGDLLRRLAGQSEG